MRATNFNVITSPPAPIGDQTTRLDESFEALLTRHSGGAARPAYITAAGEGDWIYKESATKWIWYWYDGDTDVQICFLDPANNLIRYPTAHSTWDDETAVASAATTDIGAVNTPRVLITGTVAITSLGTRTNRLRIVRVQDSGLTFTHSANLVLPGSENIVARAGDVAVFVSSSTGSWRCVSYLRGSGLPLDQETEAAVASAANLDLGAKRSKFILVTGTTTVTSLGAWAWQFKIVRFAASLTLTHNATSLVLPGGANIVTAAGDVALFYSDGSGNWRCASYTRASGAALVGSGGGNGQCRLEYVSASVIRLVPYNGNKLIINNVAETVPDAGVDLAPTSLSAGTNYYVYAYMSGSTMTLEASTTAPARDGTSGVMRKSGDASRSLVGLVRPDSGPAWVSSNKKRFVISWYNQRQLEMYDFLTSNIALTASYAQISSQLTFECLNWAGNMVSVEARLQYSANAAGGRVNAAWYANGSHFNEAMQDQVALANDPFALTMPRTVGPTWIGAGDGYLSFDVRARYLSPATGGLILGTAGGIERSAANLTVWG